VAASAPIFRNRESARTAAHRSRSAEHLRQPPRIKPTMKTETTEVPAIIEEAKAAGCENADQINGYLAGEVSKLREALKRIHTLPVSERKWSTAMDIAGTALGIV
jgi:hypothetical protein